MIHANDKPHHILSPSSAHRWLHCTASAMAEAKLPQENSAYADEGSEAHDLAAHCLDNRRHGVDVTDNDEMAEAIQVYLDYVRVIPGERLVEQKLDLGHISAGMFGTADCIVLDAGDGTATGTLHVVDFKYGAGVVVEAENNEQLLLYAAGALEQFGFLADFTTVQLTIVQPRRDHISEWTLSVDELAQFIETAQAKAAEALSDASTFAPSVSACRFCRAAGDCDALAKHAFKTVAEGFEDLDALATRPIEPDDVSTYALPVLGHKLDQVPLIKGWIEAVEARATRLLEDGGTVPGYKLVESRTQRRWSDETTAEAALRGRKLKVADIFKKSLISPAQAEKLLGKGHPIFDDLVVSPKGRPVIAPEADKRPAYRDSVASGFEDLDSTTSNTTPNDSSNPSSNHRENQAA